MHNLTEAGISQSLMCDLFACRLKIAKGVIVNKLFIKVNSSDSSYMPERVIVMGCYSTTGKQHSLKETTIPLYEFCYFSPSFPGHSLAFKLS